MAGQKQQVLEWGAGELAGRLRRGELSVLEVVDAHLARIEAVNPRLNALVAGRFVAARQEALAAEARLANAPPGAPLPPLLGVPFTAQEAVGVAGMPRTGGSVYRWDVTARRDDVAVRRLRAAGAIPLGVTNLPEAGLWPETHNLLYERTVNPWQDQHTVGGAAGGEGALVAAGGSPLGVGSGFLSAVTLPAAFCGVVGHQPSGRRAPPASGWGASAGMYLGCGVLTRSCQDLRVLVEILSAESLPPAPAPRDLRVFVVESVAGIRPSAVVAEGLERCAAALAEAGAAVEVLRGPALDGALPAWASAIALRAPGDLKALLGDGVPVPVWKELMRFPMGRANHTSAALALALLEEVRRLQPADPDTHQATVLKLRLQLRELLGEGGVLLHPAYSRPAPRHRGTLVTPLDLVLSCLPGSLEMPSTVVPIGFDVSGLPLAAQLTALPEADHLTIAAAGILERAFGGWVRAQPAP